MLASFLFLVFFCFACCLVSGSAGSVPAEVAESVPVARSCSLEVRSAVVPSSCCLLLSRSGGRLSGGALPARVGRLRRLGVLV